MARKKRKAKQAFWNKIGNPELKRISEHIGKIFDNSSVREVSDLAMMLFCAYGGYEAGRKLGGNTEQNLGVAGSAALAFKLAQQPNLIAGASGVGYLASLGLINVWNPLTQAIETVVKYPVSTDPFDFWHLPWGVPLKAIP